MNEELYQPQNSQSIAENKVNNQNNSIQSFKIQLTFQQLSYLSKLLPKFYSFQLQTQQIKKKISSQKSIKEQTKISLQTKKSSKVDNKAKNGAAKLNKVRSQKSKEEDNENVVYQKYNVQKQISRNNSYDDLSQSLRPCIKILNLLKNSKTSWPFREPVDPIALDIPHYTQIIKQPMDLSTIQTNLSTNQYISPTQFHADVSKIITNSYIFNSSNAYFKTITSQFQTYYHKITSNPAQSIQNQIEVPLDISHKSSENKIKKESSRNIQKTSFNTTISMNEKKELGLNIKRLPRQHMKGILDIVNQGKNQSVGEFDLKELDPQIIRKLQNYVKDKLGGVVKSKQFNVRNQRVKQNKHKQESSFEIDQQEQS